MKSKLQLLWAVLFWGSMWGIVEATMGSVVAAAIKLVDFVLPGAADNVLHPAFYILLEGAMTAVVSLLFSIEPRKTSRPAWSLLEARLAVPAFATAVALTIFVG